MSETPHGRPGGLARAARQTPQERRDLASQGHLAMAVAVVCNKAPELTPEQVDRLRSLFGGAQ